MKAVVVALALFAVAAAAAPLSDSEYETLFSKWVERHGKVYETNEEFFARYHIFRANMDMIIKHNLAGKSWTLAMNQFGDLTRDEFRTINGYRASNKTANHRARFNHHIVKALPTSWDWRTKGVVTPVKNQGQCGSCWAFSTTGSVEGAWAQKHSLVSLSEQELVDCADSTGNQGCNGGEMQQAMQWIINNGGDCSESAYPYKAVDGTCASTTCTNVATISKYVNVDNSEAALQAAVAITPVSVAVDASGSDWQFYSGGVVNDPNCYNQLDHGVLAVGWGVDSTAGPYWIVKNSWGESWGMSGYILLARNVPYSGGECGITMDASYPVV